MHEYVGSFNYRIILYLFLDFIPVFAMMLHAAKKKILPIILQSAYILLRVAYFIAMIVMRNPEGERIADPIQICSFSISIVIALIILVYLCADRPEKESVLFLLLLFVVSVAKYIIEGGVGTLYYTSVFSDEFNRYCNQILIPSFLTGVLLFFGMRAAGLSPGRWFRTYAVSQRTKTGVAALQIGAGVAGAASVVCQFLCAGILGSELIHDFNWYFCYYQLNQQNASGAYYIQKVDEIWPEVEQKISMIKTEIVLSYTLFTLALLCAAAAVIQLFLSARKNQPQPGPKQTQALTDNQPEMTEIPPEPAETE